MIIGFCKVRNNKRIFSAVSVTIRNGNCLIIRRNVKRQVTLVYKLWLFTLFVCKFELRNLFIMSHKTILHLLSILICCLSVSCHSIIEKELDDVEFLLDNHPDSALSILTHIDSKRIRDDRTRAHHALLTSAALDKNYIDIDDDSLICIANNYYQKHGNQINRMRAYYYYGVVKMNAKDYATAVVFFEKAGQEARHLNNLRYLGLAHRNMGIIFHKTGNYLEAKKHNKKAIDVFELNQDSVYTVFAKYSLALDYMSNKQMDSCRLLLNELRKDKYPGSLKWYVDINYASTFVSKEDSLNEAINTFRIIPHYYFSPVHYGYYANAFAKLSQLDSAKKWMEEGYKASKSKTDSARLHSFVYGIDLLEGHPQTALEKVVEAMAVQDSTTRQTLLQSLSIAQMNYYQQEASFQKERAKKNRIQLILGIFILLLVLLCVLLFFTKRQEEKESLLKEQMAQLAIEQQNTIKGNSLLVGTMFLEKMVHLCGLSSQYYSAGDEYERIKFLDKFQNAVKELKNSPDLQRLLEADLNQYCSGVMDKLKEQVPVIKGENRSIIAMFFAGIPDAFIQIIMNRVSIGSLKTLRSRLRQKIVEAHAPDEELFLKMLTAEKATGKEIKNMK